MHNSCSMDIFVVFLITLLLGALFINIAVVLR